ncbi:MAG: DUF6056 family protein, partial [Fusobacteriaceae bacterium]
MKLIFDKSKKVIEKYLIYIIFFIIFSGIFFLNHYTPIMIDDYNFQYMYGVTKNIIRVDSLDKIARTTLTFYFQRGGRVLGIILEQIFLILPK